MTDQQKKYIINNVSKYRRKIYDADDAITNYSWRIYGSIGLMVVFAKLQGIEDINPIVELGLATGKYLSVGVGIDSLKKMIDNLLIKAGANNMIDMINMIPFQEQFNEFASKENDNKEPKL